MKFKELKIKGTYLIEFEEFKDERGSFTRQFCQNELAEIIPNFTIRQCNISRNYKKGVIRGMHYQKAPYPENKIVFCTQGAFLDVIVDLRKESETYLQWESIELTQSNNKALFIPHNCAHGFQTLVDDTVVFYQLDEFFMSDYYCGIRYSDPKIGIKWHDIEPVIINDRDANYELLK